ncbi:hypothetical protein [Amycolatopsis magusensis]|uniref:hypothetical protein n=1 Tax=Amycolatopsis magusensis TaxID=882444 RepID=UPI0024A97D8A|nr:hypothetical protein [Amycolatopsis magusensis]MDI5975993.1 hypothetical protein [Amycolatopsis magusensis]
MIQFVTSTVMIASLIVAALSVRAAKRQRLRQFETVYVQRYWALMDRLSLDALRGEPVGDLVDDDQRAVRAYLRLCEDQLDLRRRGWLSASTWLIWAEGSGSS